MHGKWVPKVKWLGLFLKELAELGGKIRWGGETQDLAGVFIVPSREVGHFKPLVVLLARCVLGATVVAIVRLTDPLDQASEPAGWELSANRASLGRIRGPFKCLL